MKVEKFSSALAWPVRLVASVVIGAGYSMLSCVIAAEPATTPEVAQADQLSKAAALMQSGDITGEIRILQSAVTRDPANAQAWGMLGVAYQGTKHFEQALASFEKVLLLKPDSAKAMYAVGALHARAGHAELAFEWLGKARATHKLDMTAIQTDVNVDSIRNDPRFGKLLPVAEDFAKPFVEDVKIIHEWDGEAINDQFGWIARSIGDVDNDGAADFVTSAPTKNIKGENAGRIYVYSSRSGKLLWQADGKPGEQLGTGLEAAGDTNHDGVPDVVAGAPGSDTAYVFSGRDGHALLTLHAEGKGDNFGQHVSSVGDIDHDGYADIIVGAPNNHAGGKDAGRAYVYSGKDGHLLLTLTGERAGDLFGSTVAGYTDAARSFVVVGAPAAGPRKTGRVYVYDGLKQKPKFTADSDATGNALGLMFVAVVGDVDGDHVPDIYASDWSNSAKGPSTGRVYVYSGRSGKTLLTFTGETSGEGFGTTHSTTGDVDHDGHADLLVGAWQYAGAAISGGRAYLFSGKDGKLVKTYTCRTPGDTFGFDAVGMGDIDGDGTDDFLITSGWSGVHGFHSGRIFLISSGVGAKGG